jgi:hypothetical protein
MQGKQSANGSLLGLAYLSCSGRATSFFFRAGEDIYNIGWGPFQSRRERENPWLSLIEPFGTPFAITDRRFLLARGEAIDFEAVYDPNSTKKYIESARAKNEPGSVTILTAAKLYKRLLTALDFDTAKVWVDIPRGVEIRKNKYELYLFKPLSTHIDFRTMKAALLDSGATTWFTPIMRNYMKKANARYEPLLELVQAKAQEMSGLVKELEALTV